MTLEVPIIAAAFYNEQLVAACIRSLLDQGFKQHDSVNAFENSWQHKRNIVVEKYRQTRGGDSRFLGYVGPAVVRKARAAVGLSPYTPALADFRQPR
jgi:hypothetical protein